MWLWLTVCSALLLGIYDVFKKQALKLNGVYWILVGSCGLTTLFLSPFLSAISLQNHLCVLLKAVLVSTSWVSGLIAMKHLPLTTVSTIKASRPMFVVIFSIILFGERLSLLQWVGVAIVMTALFLSSRSKQHETDKAGSFRGMVCMIISVVSGAASALYDKHIISGFEPLALQSWTNLYITALLALILLIQYLADKEHFQGFAWDWRILIIAVLITAADAAYFFAIKDPDAMLSVISIIRRCSVLVTFLGGALILKEGQIRDKALDMVLMMAGVGLLLYATA